MVPIMEESVTGSPINVISFDSFNVDLKLNLHLYALKRVKLSLGLYPNIIKGGYLSPLFLDAMLKRKFLLAIDTDLMSFQTSCRILIF